MATAYRGISRIVEVIIIALVVAVSLIILLLSGPLKQVPSTITVPACSPYCSTSENETLTLPIKITYPGAWEVNYQTYSGLASSSNLLSTISYNGTGDDSRYVVLTGNPNSGLTACARASKIDDLLGTNLTLQIDNSNPNSSALPHATVSVCVTYLP